MLNKVLENTQKPYFFYWLAGTGEILSLRN